MRFNTSERRHKVHRSVPNTTANAFCYIHWHYRVVGVTVTLALLRRGPAPSCSDRRKLTGSWRLFFGRAHCVCFSRRFCSRQDEWGTSCPVLKSLMLCCPPTAPPCVPPFQALMLSWESRGSLRPSSGQSCFQPRG